MDATVSSEAREKEILQMLQAEYRYWAELDEGEHENMVLASMIAMGALANVVAAIQMGLSAEEYRTRIQTQRRSV